MKIYSIPLVLCFIISISSVSSQSEGSCVGRCGQGYVRADPCHCDYNCMSYMECCQDYKKVCTTEGSCKGRCHEGFIRGQTCDCDPGCTEIGKCCPDYKGYCVKPEKELQPPPSPPDQPDHDEKDKPPEPTKKPDKVAEDVPEDRIQKDEAMPEKANKVPLDRKDPSKATPKIAHPLKKTTKRSPGRQKRKKYNLIPGEDTQEPSQNRPTSSLSSPQTNREKRPRRPGKKKYRTLIHLEDDDEEPSQNRPTSSFSSSQKNRKKRPRRPGKKKYRKLIHLEDDDEDSYEGKATSSRHKKIPPKKDKKNTKYSTSKKPRKKKKSTLVEYEDDQEDPNQKSSSPKDKKRPSKKSSKIPKKKKKVVESEEEIEESEENMASSSFSSSSSSSSVKGSKTTKKLSRKNQKKNPTPKDKDKPKKPKTKDGNDEPESHPEEPKEKPSSPNDGKDGNPNEPRTREALEPTSDEKDRIPKKPTEPGDDTKESDVPPKDTTPKDKDKPKNPKTPKTKDGNDEPESHPEEPTSNDKDRIPKKPTEPGDDTKEPDVPPKDPTPKDKDKPKNPKTPKIKDGNDEPESHPEEPTSDDKDRIPKKPKEPGDDTKEPDVPPKDTTPKDKDKPKNPKTPKTKDGNDEPESHPEEPTSDGKDRIPKKPKEPGDDTKEPDVPPKEPTSDDNRGNPKKPKGTGDDPEDTDVSPKEPNQGDPDNDDKPRKTKTPKENESDDPEDTGNPPNEPNPKEKKKPKKTISLEIEENTEEHTDVNSANADENTSQSKQRTTRKRSPTNSKKKPKKPEDDTDDPSQNPSPSDRGKKKPNSKRPNKKKGKPTDGDDPSESPSPSDKGEKNPNSKEPNKKKGKPTDEDGDEPSKLGKGKNPKKKPNPKGNTKIKKKINSEEERQETVESEFSSSSQSASSHTRSKSTRRLTGKNKKKPKDKKKIPDKPEDPLMPPKPKKDKGSPPTPVPTFKDEGSGDDGSGMDFLSTTTPTTTLMVHSTTTASLTTRETNQTERTVNPSKSPTKNPDVTSDNGTSTTPSILTTKEGPEKNTNLMNASTQSPTAEDTTTGKVMTTDTPLQQSKNLKYTTAMNDLEASVIVTHTVAGKVNDVTTVSSQDDGSTVKHLEIDTVGKDITSFVTPPSLLEMAATKTTEGKKGIESTLNPGITQLKTDSVSNNETPEEANKETSPYPISRYNTAESPARTSIVVKSTANAMSEKGNAEDSKTTMEDTRAFAQTTPSGVNKLLISPEVTRTPVQNVTLQKMQSTEENPSPSVGPGSTSIFNMATKPTDTEHILSTTALDEVHKTEHFHTLAEAQNIPQGLTEGLHDLPPATSDATEYVSNQLLISASASHMTPSNDESSPAHSRVTTDIPSESSTWTRSKDSIIPTEINANNILRLSITTEPSQEPKTETDKNTHREEKISTPDTLDNVETIPSEQPTYTEAQNVNEKKNTSQSIGKVLPDTTSANINLNTAQSTANTRITESESLSKTTAENMSNKAFTAESSQQSKSATEEMHLPTGRELHSTSETLREEQTSVDKTSMQATSTQSTVQTIGTEITKGTVTDIIATMGPTESKTSSDMAITENTIQSRSVSDSTTEKTIPVRYTAIVTTSAEAEKSTDQLHSTILPMELSTREAPMEVSSDESIQGTNTHPPTTTLSKDVTVSDVRPTGTTLDIVETIPTEPPSFTEAQNVNEKQNTSQSVGEILPDIIKPMATTDTAPSTANTRIPESESLSKTTAENTSDNAFTAASSEQSESATEVTHLPTEREVHSASETLREEQTSVDTTTIKTALTQKTGQTVGTEITKGTVTDIIATMGPTEGKTSSDMAITENTIQSSSVGDSTTEKTIPISYTAIVTTSAEAEKGIDQLHSTLLPMELSTREAPMEVSSDENIQGANTHAPTTTLSKDVTVSDVRATGTTLDIVETIPTEPPTFTEAQNVNEKQNTSQSVGEILPDIIKPMSTTDTAPSTANTRSPESESLSKTTAENTSDNAFTAASSEQSESATEVTHLPTEREVHSASETLREEQTSVDTTTIKTALTERTGQTVGTEITKGTVTDIIATMGPTDGKTSSDMAITENTIQSRSVGDSTTEKTIPISYTAIVMTSAEAEKGIDQLHSTLLPMELSTHEAPMEVSSDENIQGANTHAPTTTLSKDVTVSDVRPTGTTLDIVETIPTEPPTFTEAQNVNEKQNTSQSVGEILPDTIKTMATTDTAPSTANTRSPESESISKTTAENTSDNAFTAASSEQSESATEVTHLPTEREVHSASETLREEQTSVDTTTIKTALTQRTGQTVGTEITKGTVTDIIATMGPTEGKTSSDMAITENTLNHTVSVATESKSLTEDITNHIVTLATATDMTKVIESMERTGTETLLTPSVPDILKNSLSTAEVPDGDEATMTTYSSKITTKSQTGDISNKIHSPTSLNNVDYVTEKTTAISYTAIVTSSAEAEKSTAQLHNTPLPMEFSTHETPREETDENIQGRSTNFQNFTDTTVSPDVSPTDTIHKATDILAGTPLTERANTEKFPTQSITPLPRSVEVREGTKSTEAHPSPTKTTDVLSEATEFTVKGTDEKPATYMLSTVVEGLLSMVEATDSFSMERTLLTHTSKDNIIISNTAQALQTTDITKQRNTVDIQSAEPPSKITTIDLSTAAENTEIGKSTTSSESSHLSSSEQTFPVTEATTNTKNIYGMTVTSDAEVSVSEIKITNGGQTERMYETSQTPKDVTMEKESLAGTTMQSPLLSVTTEHHNGGSTYPTSLPNDSKTDPLLMSSTVEGESNNPTVSLTSDIDYTSKDPNETGHEKQTISAQTIKDSTTITLMGITDILFNLATSDKPTPSDVPEYQKPDVSPTNSLLKKETEEPLKETFSSVMPGDGITSSVTAPLTFSQKDKSIEITLINAEEQPTVTQVVQFIEATSTKLPSSHEITHTESITNRDDNIVTGNVGLSEISTITDPNRNNALHQTTHQALVKNTQETVHFTSVKTSVHYTRPTEDLLTTSDNMKIITVTTLVPKETDTNSISSSSPFFAKTTQIQTDASAHEVTGMVHTTQWPQTEVSTEQSERTPFSTNVRDRPLSGVTMASRMTTESTSTTLSIVTNEEPIVTHVGTNTIAEGTEELPLSKEQMSTITEVPILLSTQDSQETSPISRLSLSGTSHHPLISKEDTIKPELVTGDTNADQLDTSISTIVAKEHLATTEDANVLTTVLDKDSSADQSNYVTRNAEGIFIMTTEKNKSLTTQLSSQGDAATYSSSSTVDLTKSTLATTNKDTPTSTSFKLLDKYYTTGDTADSSRAKALSFMDITRAQGLQTGEANTEHERVTSEPIEAFSPTRKDHLLSTLLDIDTSRIRNTYGLTPLHSSVSPKYASLPDITSRKHGFESISTSGQGLGGSIDQNVPINAVSSSVTEAKVTNSKHTSKLFASTSYMNLHDPSFNFTVSTLKTLQDQSTTDSSDITHITVSGKLQETTNALSFNSEPVDPTKHTLPITYNGKYITSKQATGTWRNANAPSEFTDNPLDQSTGYFMAHTNIMPFSTTATTQKSEQAQTKETIAYSDITVITESTTRHSDHTTKTTTKEPSTEPQQKPTTELLAKLTTEIPEGESEISTIISTSKHRPTPTKSMIFQTTTIPTDKDDTEMSTMSMRPTKRPYPRGVPTNRPIEPEEMEHTKTTKPSTTNQYHVCDLLKDEAIKLRISDDDLQRITEICTEMQQQHPFVSTPSPDVKQPITGDSNIPPSYPHLITPNWNQQPGTRIIQIVEEIYRRMNSSPMTNITVVHGYTVHKPSKWLLLLNKIKSSNDPQKNLCIGQPADGMTTLQNGSMVVFRGHYFWTLNQGGVMGCPRKITEVWGIPSPIDTVFTRCNCGGKTFFFKDSRYWRFTNDAMDQGYPKEIIKGFGGLRGKVTAVLPAAGFRTRPESVYFFKPGGTVQRYTFRQEQAKRCTKKKRPSIQYPIYSQNIQTLKYRFPRNVVRHRIQIHRTFTTVQQPLGVLHEQTSISSTWRGIPNNIISAVSLPNSKKQDGFDYYVFSKDKYYNINMSSKTAVKPPPGSEQQTSKDWYKCKE